jgi:hypothetical protein
MASAWNFPRDLLVDWRAANPPAARIQDTPRGLALKGESGEAGFSMALVG